MSGTALASCQNGYHPYRPPTTASIVSVAVRKAPSVWSNSVQAPDPSTMHVVDFRPARKL